MDHDTRRRFDQIDESLERLHEHSHLILRRLREMEVNEQEFNVALTDFISTLDSSLNAIKTKLDGMGVASDFSDELQMLTDAKTSLTDFVAANASSTPTEPTEPPVEPTPVEPLPTEPPVEPTPGETPGETPTEPTP